MKLISVFFLFMCIAKCEIEAVDDLAVDFQNHSFVTLENDTVEVDIYNESTEYPDKDDRLFDILKPQVTYWLSTRYNPEPIKITSTNGFDPRKKVIVLLHGWLEGKNSHGNIRLRNAYIQRYDANIISVDYKRYLFTEYLLSVHHLREDIRPQLAQFLCNLNYIVPLNEVHVVGFSLGAQLAGLAGAETQQKCRAIIGRITGLDPAGPSFQDEPSERRLDKTDALFVDVIHTNQFHVAHQSIGYRGSIGHIDFYPNCGHTQPGCPLPVRRAIEDWFVSCNHHKSWQYFAESINNDRFMATSCNGCGGISENCFSDIINPDYTYMGESCTNPREKQEYYVPVATAPPFAVGPWRLNTFN